MISTDFRKVKDCIYTLADNRNANRMTRFIYRIAGKKSPYIDMHGVNLCVYYNTLTFMNPSFSAMSLSAIEGSNSSSTSIII